MNRKIKKFMNRKIKKFSLFIGQPILLNLKEPSYSYHCHFYSIPFIVILNKGSLALEMNFKM